MAFRFKLQKVLDYRQQQEDEAKARLSAAETRLNECREQMTNLLAQIREAEEKGAEVMQTAERWLHDQYLKGLRADRAALALQERLLAQTRDEARRHLTECAIGRKTLDKLKEKHKIQYNKAELKQELSFNDEIATIRHKA